MSGFSISVLAARQGSLGICPMPGRFGDYERDMAKLQAWQPDLVLTMTEQAELDQFAATGLPDALVTAGCKWVHLPIRDFGGPTGATLAAWPRASSQAREVLANKGRVLVHCKGGCGRSGMAIVRILVEMGEEPAKALERLRAVRPCAVETDEQMRWAMGSGGLDGGI